MSQQPRHLYEFGPFSIDTVNRLLLRDGKAVPLKPKVVDTLLMLVENMGRVVEKDELIEKLWPDSFVEEGNLTQNIYVLRKALDSGTESESYIETIPRRGYRFAAPVKEIPYEESGALAAAHGEIHPSSGNGEAATQQPEDGKLEEVVSARSSPAVRARISRRWILMSSTILIGVLALVGYYLLSNRERRSAGNVEIKTLAVLPFKPLSLEARDNYMGEGMADALITKLSNTRQIAVRPTSAVLRYSRRRPTRCGA
jgi:DNA-binding winged helix-turn-helix (wHTH) protein